LFQSPNPAAFLARLSFPKRLPIARRRQHGERTMTAHYVIAGAACAQCERQLTATEPVWRKQLKTGRGFFGGCRTVIAPICEACAERSHLDVWSSGPCENCGRMVHETQRHRRRHHYCCDDCREQQELPAAYAHARQRRAEVRGSSRPCAVCGEHFEPARSDAQFCSARCKQKAWRRALRLAKGDHCLTFDSRNADHVEGAP
jgi:hypothetical protein